MRRAFLVLLGFGLVILGLVGPAEAQQSTGQLIFGFGPGSKVVSQRTINAQVLGDLTVTFRGDPAAGCAAYGLCPYSGTIVVRPRSGALDIVTIRTHGRLERTTVLELGSPQSADTTSARVTRAVPGGAAGTCADAKSAFLSSQSASVGHGGSVTIRVLGPGGTLLQTRCAGPLDSDLAGVSPAVTLPVARLLRGRTTLDLSGTRSFAAHGLTGTFSSTLTMRLGKPNLQPSTTSFPPGVKTHRVRTVTEQLTVVRMSGGVTATVQGTGNPIVCGLLDSCGLSGTLSLTGGARELSANLAAIGPASRPYGDFLAALGVSRSGRSRGISVFGDVAWLQDVQASVIQGGDVCTDTAPTGAVGVPIGLGLGSVGFAGPWRTRCPGPSLDNAQPALSASFDRAALGHRQFTIELTGKGTSSDDGYVIVTQGRLSVLLRRGRITQQVTTQPG